MASISRWFVRGGPNHYKNYAHTIGAGWLKSRWRRAVGVYNHGILQWKRGGNRWKRVKTELYYSVILAVMIRFVCYSGDEETPRLLQRKVNSCWENSCQEECDITGETVQVVMLRNGENNNTVQGCLWHTIQPSAGCFHQFNSSIENKESSRQGLDSSINSILQLIIKNPVAKGLILSSIQFFNWE